MFLSQLVLNPRDAKARRDLGSPYEMHKTLWNRFPALRRYPETREFLDRILFRVDSDPTGRNAPVVLVQSAIEPDWSGLPDGYVRDPARDVETKPFDPRFRVGQRLRFRLRANPTQKRRKIAAGKHPRGTPGRNGYRTALYSERDQLWWLLHRRHADGFKIAGQWVKGIDPDTGEPVVDPETGEPLLFPNFRIDAIPEGRVRVGKGGTDAWFLAVRYEGVLEVTDPVRFRDTIAAGVGPAKGFGFGLLSVAPA